MEAEEKTKLSTMDVLKLRLTYHQARVGEIRDAIAALEANPDLEQLYALIRDCKN